MPECATPHRRHAVARCCTGFLCQLLEYEQCGCELGADWPGWGFQRWLEHPLAKDAISLHQKLLDHVPPAWEERQTAAAQARGPPPAQQQQQPGGEGSRREAAGKEAAWQQQAWHSSDSPFAALAAAAAAAEQGQGAAGVGEGGGAAVDEALPPVTAVMAG